MATQRVKLDYNHLMEQIGGFLNDKAEEDDLFVFGLGMGLELLTSYLKDIAIRAIELNDEVLIDLLKGLCVVTEKEGAE